MTLVVNLYGGPASGKSTNAAIAFGKLKQKSVDTEYVTEYAKDLTWEKRNQALGFQPYVVSKQMYKIHRLMDQVDVIITDSPIMFAWIYGSKSLPDSFYQFVLDLHKSWNTIDIFLQRDLNWTYNPKGRNQTAEGAVEIDNKIHNMLQKCSIDYHIVKIDTSEDSKTTDNVIDLIGKRLIGDRHAHKLSRQG